MGTRKYIWGLVLLLLAIPSLGAGVRVAVLQEDLGHWQEVAASFRSRGGDVSLQAFSEGYLYQEVSFLIPFGLARFDVVEVLDSWLTAVVDKLQDLSPYVGELRGVGLSPVVVGRKTVGVRLPWRGDALAAVPVHGDLRAALAFLEVLAPGGPAPQAVTPKLKLPQLSLSIGPITLTKKPEENLPGVDGALELLVSALKQAGATGKAAPLAYMASATREAVAKVARMLGVPLSVQRSEVTVVIKPLASVSPLSAGAREAVTSSLGLQKVVVPLGQLESFLKQMAGKAIVRLPYKPVPLGVTSQGVAAIKADIYHAAGITGAGVKIGIIDLGFVGLSASQARGDLPADVATKDFTGTGIESGYSHGTAVAEIVHDVAPGAKLYLIKIGDEVDLDNAVTYCIQQGIKIINHSLGWYNTNFYDGTGTIADIVRRATSAGILWVQAAGNDALNHWEGNFTDTDGDGWLDTEIHLTASSGDPIVLYLTWDGWPTTADDYDLFLYGPNGSLVASSTKTQAGSEEPTEQITYTASVSGTYTVKIQKSSGSPRRLELFSIYQHLDPHVSSSSLPAPANAAEALTVGAVDWGRYTTGPAEDYSSRGPTNDGRTKPDLVAPDNVSTGVSPYYTTFQGTSAAAPHAAGAAALLLSRDPSLGLSALRAKLLSYCVPMGDPNIYGAGRLELSLPAAPKPDLVIESLTYTPVSPRVGDTLTFTAVVRNAGPGDAGSFAVELRDGGVQRRNVSGLAAGGTHTLTFTAVLSASSVTFTAVADPDGAVDEVDESNNSRSVTVSGGYPALRADAGGPYAGTVGQPITFDGRGSTGDIVSYTWDFGDGTTGSGAVVQHAYTAPGSYTVRLVVRDRYGRTDSDTATATIQAAPTPKGRLTTDKSGYAPGETVRITFENTGTVPITLPNTAPWVIRDASGRVVYRPMAAMLLTVVAPGETKFWAWNQRDNTGSQVPPGTYAVELSTQNAGLFRREFTIRTVAKPDLIVESITYTPSSPTVGDTLTFRVVVRNIGGARAGAFYVRLSGETGYQQGYITGLSAGQSFTFTFRLPLSRSGEVFTAVADYYNRVQESDETNNEKSITVTAAMPALDLRLSLDKNTYTVGETVTVTVELNRGAYVYLVELDPDGKAVLIFPNYQHPDPRLPAGTTRLRVEAADPAGNEALYGFAADTAIPYFPTRFGNYFPVLDPDGEGFLDRVRSWLGTHLPSSSWDEEVARFQVVRPVANRPPVASFSYSPTNPRVGETVRFDASASHDPDGRIVQYIWDFGDGASGTGKITSHTYSRAGTYTVRLTVRDDDGATDTRSATLTVSAAPGPGPQPPAGMPTLDEPGIYVWGDAQDHWHITVASAGAWSGTRKFQVKIEATGRINVVSVSSGAPRPRVSGTTLTWEGSVGSGWHDLSFDLQGTLMQLTLYLDTDGDGVVKPPSRIAKKIVYIVHKCKSHPPGNPFVIGAPRGMSVVLPSQNFRIGICIGTFPHGPYVWANIEYVEQHGACL